MITINKYKYIFFIFFLTFQWTFSSLAEGRALKYFYYTVKEKDTLYTISKKFDVTIDLLKILNPKLTRFEIQPNEKLLILNQVNGFFYKIKKGDTIFSIAKNYGLDKDIVLDANHIEDVSNLVIGENIFIPINLENIPRIKSNSFRNSKKFTRINFYKPINGKLVGKVGLRFHPIKRRKIFHSGVDIKAPYGKKVYSTSYGKVIFSGYKGGYGNLIIIEHKPNWETYYGHLSEIFVEKDDNVTPSTVIGRVGMTGITTGSHLHFEIRYKDIPQKILNNKYIPQFRGKIGYNW